LNFFSVCAECRRFLHLDEVAIDRVRPAGVGWVVDEYDVADARYAHLADATGFLDQKSLRAEALRGLDRRHAEQPSLML
jgi:hypothetical protein